MILSEVTWELRDPESRFAILLDLALTFSRASRGSWGYPPEQIEIARSAMPKLTQGAAGPLLPAALARWYVTVGRVPELTSMVNRLHPPDRLEFRDGAVVIYTENQTVTVWGIRAEALDQDDPPVVFAGINGWQHEADSVSNFALTVGLSELCVSNGKFCRAGTMDDAAKAALQTKLRLAPVQALKWPVENGRDAQFVVDRKVVALIEGEFLFAAGVQDNVDVYLAKLAAPGCITWV